LRGPTSKAGEGREEGRGGDGRGREGGERREERGEGRSERRQGGKEGGMITPTSNSWIRHCENMLFVSGVQLSLTAILY